MRSSLDMVASWQGFERYQKDPVRFWVECLGWRKDWIWSAMQEMAASVRDHPLTAVKAGNGVSKSYTMAGLALWFLYSFPPCSVITTATNETQVANILWREIREAHAKAKVPLFGEPKTLTLDLQPETGLRWFALGFSTRPDTVTREATAFQGYHNENVFVIFDEAAGIVTEIWRAREGIGGNRISRFVAVGNAVASSGDFARCFKDPDFRKITISVKDTPNYREGSTRIPGVYGRAFEKRIISRYGVDSDEYRVKVLGEISEKKTPGAYYSEVIQWLRGHDRIGSFPHNPAWPVYTIWAPGFTTALWFMQRPVHGNPRFLRYYEDQGVDWAGHALLLQRFERQYGYRYGGHYAPFDVDNNQYRLDHAEGMLDLAARAGILFVRLPMEKSVQVRIDRTREFLRSAEFDREGCSTGIDRLESYHEGVNARMSDEDLTVFTGTPAKDGSDHGCLVAGTMISTPVGARPIAEIRVGDTVMGSSGSRRVSAAGLTKYTSKLMTLGTKGGRTIVCTPEHKIFIKGAMDYPELVHAQEIKGGETVLLKEGEDVVHSRRETILDEEVPVYDLTVETDHCYYANGILVSNSDAMGYASLVYARLRGEPDAEESDLESHRSLIRKYRRPA